MTQPGTVLWTPSPSRVEHAELTRFRVQVAEARGLDLRDSRALHAWSVTAPGDFWDEAWTRLGVVGERGDGPALLRGDRMRDARFFPEARLSYAENLLAGAGAPGSATAVVSVREDGVRRTLTWDELRGQVAAAAAWLRGHGVGPEDVVAGWLPNIPETLVTMLAATAVGATFTSCSPDFGTAGVLDRFGQVRPVVLVAADGHCYAGKRLDRSAVLAEIVSGLPSVRAVGVVPELAADPDVAGVPGAVLWPQLVAAGAGAVLDPVPVPFDHPGFVLYSSGTTGKPKCIVHRAAGVLLKHLVEHRLHCDLRPGDVAFYYTTCGWMMWNWLAGTLATGATVLLYDGSPFHPAPAAMFDLAEAEAVTLFGTSAKFLDAAAKAGLRPRDTHRLPALRTLTSTGSPLSAEGFGYVYDAVAPDVHLASISGGTDIVGCFVLGDPTRPVRAGEIQGPALGLAVDVVDDSGASLAGRPGERGELICRTPFPSVPLRFWGDDDGSRFDAAYFAKVPGVWAHGDFASWTPSGGLVIHGRSDATLNAGGVRIGTAEIYRQVEQLPEVAEALAIGQEWDGDTRIVLFVRLAPGAALDAGLRERVRRRLREQCSPRHVPARMVAVTDLPRTRSGKLAELAVADAVHGRPVRNTGALANPEALDLFADLPELRS
jgi:acetoacetyl-CoA synthetase